MVNFNNNNVFKTKKNKKVFHTNEALEHKVFLNFVALFCKKVADH